MNRQQPNQLGFVPISILGTKVAASTVSSVASSILPGLFKDRYAEANQAIAQVSSLSTQTGQNAQQMKQVVDQAANAYRQTIAATRDKTQMLKQQDIPPAKTDNKTGKILLAATVLVTATGIAIHKLA